MPLSRCRIIFYETLAPYGRVVFVQHLKVKGFESVRSGTRRVSMVLTNAIPANINIGGFMVSFRYRGQPPTNLFSLEKVCVGTGFLYVFLFNSLYFTYLIRRTMATSQNNNTQKTVTFSAADFQRWNQTTSMVTIPSKLIRSSKIPQLRKEIMQLGSTRLQLCKPCLPTDLE